MAFCTSLEARSCVSHSAWGGVETCKVRSQRLTTQLAIREPDQASGSLEQVAELLCALQTIAHGSSRLSSLNPPKHALYTYMRI